VEESQKMLMREFEMKMMPNVGEIMPATPFHALVEQDGSG
jgi:hypothetical protein